MDQQENRFIEESSWNASSIAIRLLINENVKKFNKFNITFVFAFLLAIGIGCYYSIYHDHESMVQVLKGVSEFAGILLVGWLGLNIGVRSKYFTNTKIWLSKYSDNSIKLAIETNKGKYPIQIHSYEILHELNEELILSVKSNVLKYIIAFPKYEFQKYLKSNPTFNQN